MNAVIPTFVQAYLDNFPFGNFTPSQSKLLTPALILSAQLNFICATAALYALLSGILFYLFWRTVAQPLTVQSVLCATREVIPHTIGVSHGQAFAAKIEHIATSGNDVNDSATEGRVSKAVGSRYARVQKDLIINHMTLELDLKQTKGALTLLQERYKNIRIHSSRFLWVFTPTIGAMLVIFGIFVYRYPRIVSTSPQNTKAAFFSALFTWSLGIWRSVSLLGISSLIRCANSDVSGLSFQQSVS
jgi:hypothetical protein